jgi:hypothetical protein
MHVVFPWSLTGSTFLFALAQFRFPGSDPRRAADLVQTLDQLGKKNQQLVKRNQHLMGKMASVRNAPIADHIPVNQVQTIDHLAAKNQLLLERNKHLLAETAALRNNLVQGSETRVEGNAGTIKKTIAWLFSTVGGGLG